jgi:hypothetical protein
MGSAEKKGQMGLEGKGGLKSQRSKSKLSPVSKALKYDPKEVALSRAIRPRARVSDFLSWPN